MQQQTVIALLSFLIVMPLSPLIATTVIPPAVISSPQTLKADTEPSSLATTVISINTATAQELATGLRGIGLNKAQAIVDYREQYGAFTDIDQLQEVKGIAPALIEQNRNRLKL